MVAPYVLNIIRFWHYDFIIIIIGFTKKNIILHPLFKIFYRHMCGTSAYPLVNINVPYNCKHLHAVRVFILVLN